MKSPTDSICICYNFPQSFFENLDKLLFLIANRNDPFIHCFHTGIKTVINITVRICKLDALFDVDDKVPVLKTMYGKRVSGYKLMGYVTTDGTEDVSEQMKLF